MPNLLQWILYGLAGLALIWLWLRRTRDDPVKIVVKLVVSGILAIYFLTSLVPALHGGGLTTFGGLMDTVVCALILAILWTPHAVGFFGNMFGSLYDGGDLESEPVPLYSIALARRAAGKYREAVWEIQKQLEKFPDDFMGQMLLATIQAEDLQDLPSAQNTIERFLVQPAHPPAKIAAALTHLADWQLQLADDPVAARAAFERILDRLPGTEQAQLATQRLAHLENYRATKNIRQRGTLVLRPGEKDLGLKEHVEIAKPEEPPAAAAARLVEHLRLHPADWEAREQLATIYIEHYERPDLALGELEQLIAEPQQPAKHVARWLNRIVELHLERHDNASARAALQRLISRLPNTAAAELARSRLLALPPAKPSQPEEGR